MAEFVIYYAPALIDDQSVSGLRAVPGGPLPNIGDPDPDPRCNGGNVEGVHRVSESSGRSPLGLAALDGVDAMGMWTLIIHYIMMYLFMLQYVHIATSHFDLKIDI
jgi:hypothetical protein